MLFRSHLHPNGARISDSRCHAGVIRSGARHPTGFRRGLLGERQRIVTRKPLAEATGMTPYFKYSFDQVLKRSPRFTRAASSRITSGVRRITRTVLRRCW